MPLSIIHRIIHAVRRNSYGKPPRKNKLRRNIMILELDKLMTNKRDNNNETIWKIRITSPVHFLPSLEETVYAVSGRCLSVDY